MEDPILSMCANLNYLSNLAKWITEKILASETASSTEKPQQLASNEESTSEKLATKPNENTSSLVNTVNSEQFVLIGNMPFVKDSQTILKQVFQTLDSHSHSLLFIIQNTIHSIEPTQLIKMIEQSPDNNSNNKQV